jgi:predicted nucleic-acid-binding Zn-ribbon protein
MNFESAVKQRFRCFKCGSRNCRVEKIATTGAGLTRLFDWQTNVFYAVICENCGYVELYYKEVVDGKRDVLMDILDTIFG